MCHSAVRHVGKPGRCWSIILLTEVLWFAGMEDAAGMDMGLQMNLLAGGTGLDLGG